MISICSQGLINNQSARVSKWLVSDHICTKQYDLTQIYPVLLTNVTVRNIHYSYRLFALGTGVWLSSERLSSERDHFVNAPSQWETTLHCNVVSHWLGHSQNDSCSDLTHSNADKCVNGSRGVKHTPFYYVKPVGSFVTRYFRQIITTNSYWKIGPRHGSQNYICTPLKLTHRDLVTHTCVSKLGHHWFRWWLDPWSAPSH